MLRKLDLNMYRIVHKYSEVIYIYFVGSRQLRSFFSSIVHDTSHFHPGQPLFRWPGVMDSWGISTNTP